jgi:hypothetical protein
MPPSEQLSGHTATPRMGGQAGKQESIIAGARSLNEQDLRLHDNLHFFKVPEAGMESIRSKLVLKIYDEYVNELRRMYSVRFNGSASRQGTSSQSSQSQSAPSETIPPLINTLEAWIPTKFRKHKGRRRRELIKLINKWNPVLPVHDNPPVEPCFQWN